MRRLTRLLGLTLSLLTGAAGAAPYDLVLGQLAGETGGPAADADFRAFARSWGAALSAANLAPAETLGHSAFAASLELSVLSFDISQVPLPTEGRVQAPVLVPSLHVRKGLPFSFEVGARVGWVEKSRMYTATGELKFAVTEGFAYLPDVSARLYATRLFNARDLSLTTAGLDFGVSKQFSWGGMATLTPYGGWNPGFTGAYARPLAPAERQSTPRRLAETGLFDNPHQRFYAGVRLVSGAIQLGPEVSFTSIPSFTTEAGQARNPPSLLAFNAMFGLDF
jgi:hypothetical protein